MTAGLDTWRPTDRQEWLMLSATPPPGPKFEIDLNWWTIEGIPDLGGNAFHYPGDMELTGVRVKPPPMDPHAYHAARKEKKKVQVLDPKPDTQADQPEDKRPTSRRRKDRSQSCAAYDQFHKSNSEDEKVGRHRDQKQRGRSRNPHYLR